MSGERAYEWWEVKPLDAHVASRIRELMHLEEEESIPLPLWKTLTDFAAESSGNYVGDPMDEQVLKFLILLADQRYPTPPDKHVEIVPGAVVFSRIYNRNVIYVRPAPLGRALVCADGGNWHNVPMTDLVVDEYADPNSEFRKQQELGEEISAAIAEAPRTRNHPADVRPEAPSREEILTALTAAGEDPAQ